MLVIVPFVFGFVLLVMFWGRQSEAAQHVTHAAAISARAGAQARTRTDAITNATTAVTQSLTGATTACAGGPQLTVIADRWGPGGLITVTVDCAVAAGDLTAIGAPVRRYRATSQAIIDRYKGYLP